MRSIQENVLAEYFTKLRKGSIYNRKWWNPLCFSMYIHDLIQREQIEHFVEVGTGNGVTACWASLAGAHVWSCDIENRPKVFLDEKFPLPYLFIRMNCFYMGGSEFLKHQTNRRDNKTNLILIDGPTSAKGFRRIWDSVIEFAREGDFVVSPIGHPEIYDCWQKLANVGFKVLYNSSTESFTTRWPNVGTVRDW